jgi:hypothetical protein
MKNKTTYIIIAVVVITAVAVFFYAKHKGKILTQQNGG